MCQFVVLVVRSTEHSDVAGPTWWMQAAKTSRSTKVHQPHDCLGLVMSDFCTESAVVLLACRWLVGGVCRDRVYLLTG